MNNKFNVFRPYLNKQQVNTPDKLWADSMPIKRLKADLYYHLFVFLYIWPQFVIIFDKWKIKERFFDYVSFLQYSCRNTSLSMNSAILVYWEAI